MSLTHIKYTAYGYILSQVLFINLLGAVTPDLRGADMNKSDIPPATEEPTPHVKPRGAILIVTLVGLTTLAVWFGLFAISAGRYTP